MRAGPFTRRMQAKATWRLPTTGREGVTLRAWAEMSGESLANVRVWARHARDPLPLLRRGQPGRGHGSIVDVHNANAWLERRRGRTWRECRDCGASFAPNHRTRNSPYRCSPCGRYRKHRMNHRRNPRARSLLSYGEFLWSLAVRDAPRHAVAGEFWCRGCCAYLPQSEQRGRGRNARCRRCKRVDRYRSPRSRSPLRLRSKSEREAIAGRTPLYPLDRCTSLNFTWLSVLVRLSVRSFSEAARALNLRPYDNLPYAREYHCLRKMCGGALATVGGLRRAPPELVEGLLLLREFNKRRHHLYRKGEWNEDEASRSVRSGIRRRYGRSGESRG